MRTYGDNDMRTFKLTARPGRKPGMGRLERASRKQKRMKVTALDVVHVHDRPSYAAVATALARYAERKIKERREKKIKERKTRKDRG